MSFALILTAGVNESAPMRDAVNVHHDFNQSARISSFTHLFAQVYSCKHMESTIYTPVGHLIFSKPSSTRSHWITLRTAYSYFVFQTT